MQGKTILNIADILGGIFPNSTDEGGILSKRYYPGDFLPWTRTFIINFME